MRMSPRRTRLLLVAAAVGAAIGACAPDAHADPADTVGVQAAIVCATLAQSPTVPTILSERSRLLSIYTEESENKVMYFAMHTVCPQYQYLAYAAMQQIINGGGVSV